MEQLCCQVGGNLGQRLHHKGTVGHQRMRDLQVGVIDVFVAVQQDIDVHGAIGITVDTLMLPAEVAFDGLRCREHFAGRQLSAEQRHGVEEGVVALEPPRFGLDERRAAHEDPYSLHQCLDGLEQQGVAVAKIASEGEIEISH